MMDRDRELHEMADEGRALMIDYIKREDALNTIRNTFTGITADTMELRINDIPSADVAPVRHGRWMDMKGFWMCSECHKDTLNLFSYCPYCGAKMDR